MKKPGKVFKLIGIAVLLLCVWGMFSALVAWHGQLLLHTTEKAVKQDIGDLWSNGNKYNPVQLWKQVAGSPGIPAEAFVELALAEKSRGDQTDEMGERIRWYCRALSSFGQALKYRPQQSDYLMNWANVRQILGDLTCEEELTTGSYQDAIILALKSDPNNNAVLFSAGLLYLWADARGAAFELFKRLLTLGTTVSSAQEDYIFEQLRDPQELKLVVPPRFPQVGRWSRRLWALNPERKQAFRPVLAPLQLTALKRTQQELESGAIPGKLHLERLMGLWSVAATEKVRQELDRQLEHYYRIMGASELAGYFKLRSQLEQLAVVKAVRYSDTRPLHGSLVRWNEIGRVNLDTFYQTIGFYLPEGSVLKLIELQAFKGDAAEVISQLKVLVSENNRDWVELGPLEVTRSWHKVGDQKLLALTPQSRYFKYWKIHYGSATRLNQFGAALDNLLNLYGRAPRRLRNG